MALWFPCVLWNCIRPEQLWCLNPKKILNGLPMRDGGGHKRKATVTQGDKKEAASSEDGKTCLPCQDTLTTKCNAFLSPDDDSSSSCSAPPPSAECWICYDGADDNSESDSSSSSSSSSSREERRRGKKGSPRVLISPCDCKGDVGVVHHDCLKRWLMEVSKQEATTVEYGYLHHFGPGKI